MIKVIDRNGHVYLVNKDQIVSVNEAGASSKWHGIHTFIKLTDGQTIECCNTIADISTALNI